MSDTTPNSSGPPQDATQAETSDQTPSRYPKVRFVVILGFVAIIFTALWLGAYEWLNKAIWGNSFVMSNRWTFPVGVLLFSLLVGLAQKYLRAPNVINGGAFESMKGDGAGKIDYTTFPGALLSSFFSLLSGASVGPEGPLAFLIQDITAWISEKLKVAEETRLGVSLAALASAYNGIIGNPLFTGVLATEFQVGGKELGIAFLAWNLLAGVIGYFFFTLLRLPVFAKYIPFTPISSLKPEYALYAILLGLVGTLVTLLIAASFQLFGRIMGRFGDRVILRALAAGVVIAIIGYFFPEVRFAGETQIFPMVQNPVAYGVGLLLLLALLKILLLGLSFKSGYLGGPTFPTLFSCTMVAMALSLIFPAVPVSILVLCTEAAAVSLLLSAPLASILLVAVVGTADPYLIALMCLSTVTSMFIGLAARRLMARRAANKEAETPPLTTSATE
ncbi:MAG TPA: chloride channel protein [Ktedonobacteraceae bacterium]|nr:chloride channel protein [Ktedonobacteraceae bacterium]